MDKKKIEKEIEAANERLANLKAKCESILEKKQLAAIRRAELKEQRQKMSIDGTPEELRNVTKQIRSIDEESELFDDSIIGHNASIAECEAVLSELSEQAKRCDIENAKLAYREQVKKYEDIVPMLASILRKMSQLHSIIPESEIFDVFAKSSSQVFANPVLQQIRRLHKLYLAGDAEDVEYNTTSDYHYAPDLEKLERESKEIAEIYGA